MNTTTILLLAFAFFLTAIGLSAGISMLVGNRRNASDRLRDMTAGTGGPGEESEQ